MNFTLPELLILLKAIEGHSVFCADHETEAQAKKTAIIKLKCAIVEKEEAM